MIWTAMQLQTKTQVEHKPFYTQPTAMRATTSSLLSRHVQITVKSKRKQPAAGGEVGRNTPMHSRRERDTIHVLRIFSSELKMYTMLN